MFNKTSLWKHLLSVLALAFIVIVIYQDSYLDYARRDQILYMRERVYFSNDWSWFTHSINLNRTRLTFSGDYFLFRPGLHFVIAIQDIFLRDNQLAIGVLSITLHFLVVVLLYGLLSRYFVASLAFLFAAFFASQYTGIEMVVWRHISPYMLSMALVFIGFLVAFREKYFKDLMVTVIFFCAMLFHEVVPVACLIFGSLLFFAAFYQERVRIQKNTGITKLMCALGLALGAYLLFDIINWFITKPSSMLSSSEHYSISWAFMYSACQNFLFYLGIGVRSVFAPFSMPLIWNKADGYLFEVDILKDSISVYYAWAIAAIGVLSLSLGISLRRIILNTSKPSDLISLWVCCGLIALTAIFSFFRMTLRSPEYANSSTYYYWFFSLFFVILIKYLYDAIIHRIPLLGWRKGFSFLGAILLILAILTQVWMGMGIIKDNYNLNGARGLRHSIQAGVVYFDLNSNACLDRMGGVIHSSVLGLGTLPLYLRKYNCGMGSRNNMVHIVFTDGSIGFIPGPYK